MTDQQGLAARRYTAVLSPISGAANSLIANFTAPSLRTAVQPMEGASAEKGETTPAKSSPAPAASDAHIAEALLASPAFLHRFGLFLEVTTGPWSSLWDLIAARHDRLGLQEVQPTYRPLLYFCVDVERLRILRPVLKHRHVDHDRQS